MTPRDFCYWLQGYFEISKAAGLNSNDGNMLDAYDCIKAHLNVVRNTRGNFNPKLKEFMVWMDFALEFNATMVKISEKLDDIFLHVIDKEDIDDGSQLEAHQQYGRWNSENQVMKC
jgi:hypothetical protein